MAEGTYEYECMRAELLGIDPPNHDEFMKKKAEEEAKQVEEEEVEAENLKEAEGQNEDLKNISGGLDELNNILSMTQKKIDRFKVRCNSITSLLKMKVGSLAGEGAGPSSEGGNGGEEAEAQEENQEAASEEAAAIESLRQSDLSKALDNHVDKLDAMLEKAERAQMSMSHQNNQMKKFLK